MGAVVRVYIKSTSVGRVLLNGFLRFIFDSFSLLYPFARPHTYYNTLFYPYVTDSKMATSQGLTKPGSNSLSSPNQSPAPNPSTSKPQHPNPNLSNPNRKPTQRIPPSSSPKAHLQPYNLVCMCEYGRALRAQHFWVFAKERSGLFCWRIAGRGRTGEREVKVNGKGIERSRRREGMVWWWRRMSFFEYLLVLLPHLVSASY
jgi:hypothetical protein